MNILRRNKFKRNINKITYGAIFTIVAVVFTVALASSNDKVEYMTFPETETYVVDVVSRERENHAASENATTEVTTEESVTVEETTTVVEEETTVKKDNSDYKGIFVMNSSGNLNIRKEADSASEVVGVLTENAGGEIIKYGKEWCKVKSGDVTGYVATAYILIGDKAEKVLKKEGYYAIVDTDILKVRSEKNTNCEVLGIAQKGESYKCKKITGDWVKISYNGVTGYVSKEFVKVEYKFENAKTIEEITKEQETEAPTEVVTEAPTTQAPTTQAPTTVDSGETNVSYNDEYLLACLVSCEAGGESYEAKLAVANIVLNRVRSSAYPNSVKAVIYQSGQFGPASNGSLARMLSSGPESGSARAAKEALAGVNNVPGYLYFGISSSINTSGLDSFRVIDHQTFY